MLDTTDMVLDTIATSVDGTLIAFTVFDEEIMVNGVPLVDLEGIYSRRNDYLKILSGVPLVDLEGIYSGNVVIYKLTDSFDDPAVASTK